MWRGGLWTTRAQPPPPAAGTSVSDVFPPQEARFQAHNRAVRKPVGCVSEETRFLNRLVAHNLAEQLIAPPIFKETKTFLKASRVSQSRQKLYPDLLCRHLGLVLTAISKAIILDDCFLPDSCMPYRHS